MAFVNLNLNYGKDLLNIKLPEEKISWIASPRSMVGVPDVVKEIQRSLNNPIGMPLLQEIVEGKRLKTSILVDDFSRPTPAKIILPELLKVLNNAGIHDEDITIIMALGTHRYMTEQEIREKLGEDVVKRIKVVNHLWKDAEELNYLGESPSGIPMYLNRVYCESKLSIALGNIVPHIYAGWSGGAKIVQPGISGAMTTAQTHLIAAKQLKDIVGIVDNSVRKEMETIAHETGLTMIINTIMKPDGEVIRVVSGDPVKAHREGVNIAEKLFTEEINKLPDLVVCSAYPADCDLWQSTKAMTVAAFCAKEDGVVILFTPSQEGDCPGHPDFVGLGALHPDKVYDMTQNGTIEDVVAASVNMTVGVVRERARIIVVTDVKNKEYVEKLGLTYAQDFEEAETKAEGYLGSIESIGVITHGGEFGPKINA